MRIAAIGDLHCKRNSRGVIRSTLDGIQEKADILVMAGDLTNRGMILEMEVLLEELSVFDLPVIAVVGNHDHEQGQAELLIRMMEGRGICVLECSTCKVNGIGFIGTKGFCGGFGERRIQSFGEQAIKHFVQTSVDEVLRMEKALESLDTEIKVGLLHYAPVKDTLVGESPELFPFLGTSLLSEAFDRHHVNVIFHGHAHHGSLEGRTGHNTPVYNVSRFLRSGKGLPPYMIYNIGPEPLEKRYHVEKNK